MLIGKFHFFLTFPYRQAPKTLSELQTNSKHLIQITDKLKNLVQITDKLTKPCPNYVETQKTLSELQTN